MKNKLWLLQIPFILVLTAGFILCERGVRGEIPPSLHELFVSVRGISTWFTDRKFKIRGPQPAKNNIVIVDIDSEVLADDRFGRWPWHRDVTAQLIENVFKAGAKVVGLDMVFSEPDRRLTPELSQVLTARGSAALNQEEINVIETDHKLVGAIFNHIDNLVLGWASDGLCQPLYASAATDCPVTDPDALKAIPKEVAKFAFRQTRIAPGFDPQKSPVLSMASMIPNHSEFTQIAEHAGFFNAQPDPDGVIRRMPLMVLSDNKAYGALTIEMARVGKQLERGAPVELFVNIDGKGRVEGLGFLEKEKDKESYAETSRVEITPLGAAEINFRGGHEAFRHISALQIFNEFGAPGDTTQNRKPASVSSTNFLKDAYVLIGVTALGVFDMRNFPFEKGEAGVDGHANILDNILSGDFLVPSANSNALKYVLLMMILGGLLFSWAMQKFEAVPALTTFGLFCLVFGFFDFYVLFNKQHTNWDTSFLYLEYACIFFVTIAAKYVIEEGNKKFIRTAFTKYVAPDIVDSILEDPTKLKVGGEKKDLTILFSDIRSFTSFSEQMDAKKLSQFLNDYLGIMTELVFENGGTLDKYIGDAVMAFWGAPLDQPHHALKCCNTAIAMMKALAENKERFKQTYGVPVEIGIGLNSGVVSVGNMGSDRSFEYTVIGDHVNLASRMEGLTKEYGVSIVTSRFTFDYITQAGLEFPPHRVLDSVKVKGKKNAVELIQVLDRHYEPEGLKLFEEGRKFYMEQRWDEAIDRFRAASSLLSLSPEDRDAPCEIFIERCQDYKLNPPPANWDGAHVMHSK